MQPKAGIPLPQCDGNPVEELFGTSGGVLWADPLGNGLPEQMDSRDGVLHQTSQHFGHDGDEIHPRRSASLMVRHQFALNANLQGMTRGRGRLSHGFLLEWEDDVDPQGRWTTIAPGEEKDGSWSGERTGDQVGHVS